MFQIKKVIKAQKRIALFVEGDTEENYFKGFKSSNNTNNTKIIIKNVVNVKGGGYEKFLKILKKSSMVGYLAFFIVLDLDKYDEEKENFHKLLDYCNKQNKIGNPHFIIGTNKDFELFSCCHCDEFKVGKSTKNHIEKVFNFKSVNDFKSYEKIYEFLNKDNRSYEKALEKLNKFNNFLCNEYSFKEKILIYQ